jgi:predicted Fe-S protein YdhL (DUF1289 family)
MKTKMSVLDHMKPKTQPCSDPGWEMKDGKLTCRGCGKTAEEMFTIREAFKSTHENGDGV